MAEWPSFLKDDYKRQQFFQQIGRFGAGLLQGSNTYSRTPVNAWSYGANALGQSMPGPGEALQQQFLQEKLKTLQAARDQQKRFSDYLSGAGPSGTAKVGSGVAAQGSVPGAGAVGATGTPTGMSGASAGSPDPLRAQAAKIAAIMGPEAAQKWYLKQLSQRTQGQRPWWISPEGKVDPNYLAAKRAIAEAGRSTTRVNVNVPGQLSPTGKLLSDLRTLEKRYEKTKDPRIGTAIDALKRQIATAGQKPMTASDLDALRGAVGTLRDIDAIAKNVGVSGRITGAVSTVEAWLGQNPSAIKFQTARNNLKLAAQSLIKGIPSNFDVQTVIDTLPSLTLPESVNRERIKQTRAKVADLIQGAISYHKAQGRGVPQYLMNVARQYGINPESVAPWDGRGDPLIRGPRKPSGGKTPAELKKKYGLE